MGHYVNYIFTTLTIVTIIVLKYNFNDEHTFSDNKMEEIDDKDDEDIIWF